MEQSHEKGPHFRTMTLKGASYQMDHLKRLSCWEFDCAGLE